MTGTQATVIDAGVGNIGNLVRALRHLGAEVEITCDPATIRASRCLVLPGVGAFRPPREVLRGAPEEAMRTALDDGATLLGICIGYQLLFDSSEEFGTTDGLALLPGGVTELPGGVPLPHIGWNRVFAVKDHPLLEGATNDDHYYFVHSFAPQDVPEEWVLGRCRHGRSFPAITGRGRIAGTQFHPEKSGGAGLRLLSNYLAWAGELSAGLDGGAPEGHGGTHATAAGH
ncbi:MAG: imidazole glycerol phosphate synthase subunit HisH [Holophagales bacterium]|nr:imidazole glycerol phosphate synthase subunit HisH [Holophagales bacterium]MYH24885.1 imidazole glycerol phosphate synthase subunit HisH [Holophagales bacterium]